MAARHSSEVRTRAVPDGAQRAGRACAYRRRPRAQFLGQSGGPMFTKAGRIARAIVSHMEYNYGMGRGLSKQQTVILGLLRGTERSKVYAKSREFTTAELLDELAARDFVNDDAPRRHQIFTVRRACDSLLNRGLVEAEYTHVEPYIWARILSWKAKK